MSKNKLFRLWILIAGLLCYSSAFPQNVKPTPKEPIAKIGGDAISEEDLLPFIGAQLQQLRNQEYELKKQALENLVNQKLLDAEARKKNITIEVLMDQEVNSQIPEPSDSEVQAYYLGQRDKLNRPFEEIKTQLRQALKQAKLQPAQQEYIRRLREKADVTVLLSPPKVFVGYDASRVRGNPTAPVTIVEFSDFQCPFCEKAYPIVKELLVKYEGRVKLAYRDFPLGPIHPQAQSAAEAARCALEQGKFWEFHDLLFENQSKLDRAGFAEYARTLRLDEKRFDSCLSSGKFRSQIEQDLKAGTNAGVTGTPAFFINGIPLTGAQPASVFEKIIEAELDSQARIGAR